MSSSIIRHRPKYELNSSSLSKSNFEYAQAGWLSSEGSPILTTFLAATSVHFGKYVQNVMI